jgi:hypothetical protein
MNKSLTMISVIMFAVMLASCDVRSDTAKREMEKFTTTPTPARTPSPEPPVDPADVIAVDVDSPSGDSITVNPTDGKKSITCTKFNRVMVNGKGMKLTIKGACRQIMVNGDKNEITAEAALELTVNGANNTIQYSRFVNGKRPAVKDNGSENSVEFTSSRAQ